MNDLKFAFRQLLKYPGFTVRLPQEACSGGWRGRAVAVFTLVLGIGASTAPRETSQQLFELVDSQPGIADDFGHRIGIDGIIPRNLDRSQTVAQDDVPSFADHNKTGSFQGVYGSEVRDTRELRHGRLNRDLFPIDFGSEAGLDLRLNVEVFLDCNADVFQRLLFGHALAAAAREIVAPYGETLFRLHQSNLILHRQESIASIGSFKSLRTFPGVHERGQLIFQRSRSERWWGMNFSSRMPIDRVLPSLGPQPTTLSSHERS